MRWSLLLGLAALAGGGYLAWKTLGGSPAAPRDDKPVVDEGEKPAALGSNPVGKLADGNPFGPPGPVVTAEAKAELSSRLVVRRIAMLKEIAARGTDDPTVAAQLDAALKSDDAIESMWAKAAAMRVAGDRKYLLEIARAAVDAPKFEDPTAIVHLVDPGAGEALLRAIRESKKSRPAEGIDTAIQRLAKDGQDGAAAVGDAIARAQGDELAAWLTVAGGIRPLPTPSVSGLLERWRRGTPSERAAVQRFLMGNDADVSLAGTDVSAFVVERLESKSENDVMLWGQLIRRLPSLDPALASRLLDRARASPADAQNVLATVAAMGAKAQPYAKDLVALAQAMPDATRPIAAQALAAIGADEITAYAAQRLRDGSPEERFFWCQGLAASANSGPLVEPLQSIAHGTDSSAAARAAAALVRVSSRGGGAGPSAAVAEVLRDDRASVRIAAIRELDRTDAMPAEVAEPLAKALDDADGTVRDAAAVTISGAYRLDASAGKPFVPALLRVVERATTGPSSSLPPSALPRALRSLATIAPDDPAARAAFVAASSSADFEAKKAAIWGLSRLPFPTPGEKKAFAAAQSDPRLAALVTATLARPAWSAVH